jgi:hypothetical protein
MRDLDELFAALERSRFRSRCGLGPKDRSYLYRKGLAEILDHARTFLAERLAPAQPANDGRQTPMRGHPVFVAQHATATCCRGCLAKWHFIAKGQPLSEDQIDYVVRILERWLTPQLPSLDPQKEASRQLPLF